MKRSALPLVRGVYGRVKMCRILRLRHRRRIHAQVARPVAIHVRAGQQDRFAIHSKPIDRRIAGACKWNWSTRQQRKTGAANSATERIRRKKAPNASSAAPAWLKTCEQGLGEMQSFAGIPEAGCSSRLLQGPSYF